MRTAQDKTSVDIVDGDKGAVRDIRRETRNEDRNCILSRRIFRGCARMAREAVDGAVGVLNLSAANPQHNVTMALLPCSAWINPRREIL